MMRVVVPGVPPSVNHMYRRFTVRGRTMDVITREAQAWMQEVRTLAAGACTHAMWRCRPRGSKVRVRIWYYWPDRRRRDTHNTLKALLDALEGIAYEDDRDALPQVMDYAVDRGNPRIEMLIDDLPEEATA
ncbi:MAG: RusA family crossover junction endodeoxyribonuclease [Firmicutes bacterium]|nr:RusA family crossover junction endodeoxyribonuclease [Bacillota bacterium]MBE3590841.1 RusA family crossover junction endodeoxyribonuclease [Bacillota bacterium]